MSDSYQEKSTQELETRKVISCKKTFDKLQNEFKLVEQTAMFSALSSN